LTFLILDQRKTRASHSAKQSNLRNIPSIVQLFHQQHHIQENHSITATARMFNSKLELQVRRRIAAADSDENSATDRGIASVSTRASNHHRVD
jgi:hypothetical protein